MMSWLPQTVLPQKLMADISASSAYDVIVHVDRLMNDMPCIVNYRNARIP